MKDTTSAIMFKVNADVKSKLKQAAKMQSKQRGYKVTMTALFAEWVASMPAPYTRVSSDKVLDFIKAKQAGRAKAAEKSK